jgi:plasmid stabilization system protein ParE
MTVVYTVQAMHSLREALEFLALQAGDKKASEVKNAILSKADELTDNPEMGQKEPYLTHLGLHHRRILVTNYKIIYRGKQRKYL